ncbi:FkbM family methyltransferase [Candidatus Omnitrophota bacterium]
MFTRQMVKFRLFVKRIIERNPITIGIAEFFLLNLPFFLPHDNDYYAFPKLASKDQGLFLDIGAADGRSILSFHKFKKDWDIFSIEANPLHINNLNKIKTRIPKVEFMIRAVDQLSDKEVVLYTPTYYFFKLYASASTDLDLVKNNLRPLFGPGIRKRIRYIKSTAKTITIDQLNLSPDIIKMDIEGGELNALKGSINTIKRCSPDFLIEYNQDFGKICDFFKDFAYIPYGFDSDSLKFTEFREGKFRNCFFRPAGRSQ